VRFWQDKNVVVTGGSSGLGLAIARATVNAGGNVTLVARSADRLAAARHRLGFEQHRVQIECCDVTQAEQVEAMFEAIRTRPLHAFIHAVGQSSRGRVLETTVDSLQRFMETNFYSAVRCSRLAAPLLLESRGHLVHVGSLASKHAGRFLGPYPPTKFALAAYSQQLRLELGESGLHVLLVCPGPIHRDDSGVRYDHLANELPDQARRPGAGVKLSAIDPDWLARRILKA
jgi:short-subunit dehydrogenase